MAQPSLLDQVPALGHIPRLLQVMSKHNDAISGSCLQIIRQLSNSDVSENLIYNFFIPKFKYSIMYRHIK